MTPAGGRPGPRAVQAQSWETCQALDLADLSLQRQKLGLKLQALELVSSLQN